MQQAGGSQFGVPPLQSSEMTSFTSPVIGAAPHMLGIQSVDTIQHNQLDLQSKQLAEAASPRSSVPGLSVTNLRQQASNFDELAPAVAGNLPEDDVLGSSGNRWPRQETLALLRIRSEMDATFRDATLKGPLWDEVSRKLAELGYKRSAKKCKEKFENVHKYYKRTKEGRAGRQDGKSYRFFSELEALHSNSGTAVSTTVPVSEVSAGPMAFSTPRIQVSPISAVGPLPSNSARNMPEIAPQPISGLQAVAAAAAGICFSSNSSSSEDDSDDEDTDEGGEGRKRKRAEEELKEAGTSKKMMAFFDGLMKQLMEKQEAMQRQLLETIEKREQERMIKEEAWRRQEMARLSREQELLAQERSIAASRDAALISYLQKIISENSVPLPALPVVSVVPPSEQAPATPTPQPKPKLMPVVAVQPLQQPPQTEQASEKQQLSAIAAATELIAVSEQTEGGGSLSFEPMSSSRWPKAEVHALINIRSSLESKYQEAGPKGPLWEEISAEMQKIGYNRNAKRCKEKWENINKYFKKVKESNKKRSEDAKTCPYFHQLDALYRQKQLGNVGEIRLQESNPNPNTISQAPAQQHPIETVGKKSNGNGGNSESGGVKVETTNGGLAQSFNEQGLKKPEDIMKELMQNQSGVMDEEDSDNMDQNYSDDDDEDEVDEENDKMQYKIQYQRANESGNGGANTTKTSTTTTTAE